MKKQVLRLAAGLLLSSFSQARPTPRDVQYRWTFLLRSRSEARCSLPGNTTFGH